MLKIKHKELARLLGISERYSRVLFFRLGLKMRNDYLGRIIELIVKRLK